MNGKLIFRSIVLCLAAVMAFFVMLFLVSSHSLPVGAHLLSYKELAGSGVTKLGGVATSIADHTGWNIAVAPCAELISGWPVFSIRSIDPKSTANLCFMGFSGVRNGDGLYGKYLVWVNPPPEGPYKGTVLYLYSPGKVIPLEYWDGLNTERERVGMSRLIGFPSSVVIYEAWPLTETQFERLKDLLPEIDDLLQEMAPPGATT